MKNERGDDGWWWNPDHEGYGNHMDSSGHIDMMVCVPYIPEVFQKVKTMSKKAECLEESEICADAVIDIFHDRKGFDAIWDDLDDDIKLEIRSEIRDIIYDHIICQMWNSP